MKNKILITTLIVLTVISFYFLFLNKLSINRQEKNTSYIINQYIKSNYNLDSNCFVSTDYNNVILKNNSFNIYAISYISCYDKNLNIIDDTYFINNFLLNNNKIVNYKETNKIYSKVLNIPYTKYKINKINIKLEKENLKKAKSYRKIQVTIKKRLNI